MPELTYQPKEVVIHVYGSEDTGDGITVVYQSRQKIGHFDTIEEAMDLAHKEATLDPLATVRDNTYYVPNTNT